MHSKDHSRIKRSRIQHAASEVCEWRQNRDLSLHKSHTVMHRVTDTIEQNNNTPTACVLLYFVPSEDHNKYHFKRHKYGYNNDTRTNAYN
eukprot:3501190-Amphidinium_carterae.1